MPSPSTTGPAKALGAMFVVGAILMAFVALGLTFSWPVTIGVGPGLYAVLGAWLMLLPTTIYSVTCLAPMVRHRLISTLVVGRRAGRALQFART